MSGYCQPRITSRHTRRGPGISAENSLGQTGATAMSSNVLASLVTDLLYAVADPRIRLEAR